MVILRSWNGCKNSRKIWLMMKFHCREALTPVLLWFQACQQICLQDLIRQLQGHFQERSHCSTSSSSSSSSPTVTSSGNETRERKDQIESDISPVIVSAKVDDRTGQPDKMSDKRLGRNSSKRQLSDARQLGCVFQDMTPPKSVLRKCTDMRKPIQSVKFTKAIARHTKIRDQNPSLGYICPGELMSVAPMLQNLRIVHKKRQSGKSKVPAKQRGSWPKMCLNSRSTKEQHSSRLRKIGACLHQR